MKLVFPLLLFVNTVFCYAQNIQKTFIVKATIDNLWRLCLKKDNTFIYTHWSGFSDNTVVDSGTYVLNKKQITFHSSKGAEGKFNNEIYYLEKYHTKNGGQITYIHTEKKRFKRKVYILTKGSR